MILKIKNSIISYYVFIFSDTKISHANKTLPISNGTQPDSYNIKVRI